MKQELHKPKGRAQTRTSTDRGAEPSFPGRQSKLSRADQDQHRPRGRALLPRQTRTSADQAAEPCHRMECHTPWARFGAMQEGWGPSAGPSRRGAEPLQAEQAFSQSAVTNPVGQGRPGPAKPGPAQTEGQSALSGHAKCMTNPVHRPRGRALGIPCWDP